MSEHYEFILKEDGDCKSCKFVLMAIFGRFRTKEECNECKKLREIT